jgi:hypothetical protein
MSEDRRLDLIEDIIEGLAHGEVANALPDFAIERVDDGTVLTIDLGDPDRVYIVTVTDYERVD